jgi:hypothetical protein
MTFVKDSHPEDFKDDKCPDVLCARKDLNVEKLWLYEFIKH